MNGYSYTDLHGTLLTLAEMGSPLLLCSRPSAALPDRGSVKKVIFSGRHLAKPDALPLAMMRRVSS